MLLSRYVATLSLALATLNLLPLPRLDGTHILSAVLGLVIRVDPDELEEHEIAEMEEYERTTLDASRNGIRRGLLMKRRLHRAISWTTTGIAVVCIGGSLVLEAL
jgi:membrane-associated protease RseP (regulator of RpoE activity)